MTEAIDYGPTKERARRSPMADVPTDIPGITAKQALIECVLDRYEHRGQITERQHEAGLRFRSIFRRAAMPPSVTSSYGAPQGMGSLYDGRRRLRRVLVEAGLGRAIDLPEPLIATQTHERFDAIEMPVSLYPKGHVAIAVCGLDEWAGGTRRLVMLREALTDLADYWGIES